MRGGHGRPIEGAHPAARVRLIAVWLLLCVTGVVDAATAQGVDCSSPQGPSIDVAIGRSSPYVELKSGVVEEGASASVGVGAGAALVGRADFPIVGPLRVRLDGATARWDVRLLRYDPNAGYRVIADESVGRMTSRHLAALVGFRTGRAPVCARVSAGGGFYAIGFRGTSVRSPGAALAAGLEFPTGSRSGIQVDGTLHALATRSRDPVSFSTVLELNVTVGWAYRF